MTRRTIFGLALGIPVAAQDDVPGLANTPAWETGKAKNGQCPVCARMSGDDDKGLLLSAGDDDEREREVLLLPPDPARVQKYDWLNRCAKCNTAFFMELQQPFDRKKAA